MNGQMNRRHFIASLLLVLLSTALLGQNLREFQVDTATYVEELKAFTGVSLESTELPDFERFLLLYDSLPYDKRMEIIEISNLMLQRRCRPRPHFIAFQQNLNEFFVRDKSSHGYADWMAGFRNLLISEQALTRTIAQWLRLSLSLMKENIFYETASVTWKMAEPNFRFFTDEQMIITFDQVTVACYSGPDFIQIKDASGFINPITMEWSGITGKVSWERVGMPETEIYATLRDYKIDLKKPGYTADSVVLYYPALFDRAVMGRLEDKVTLVKSINTAEYPKFDSYQQSFQINDYVPGINYRGGLSVEGAKLVGSGSKDDLATLDIYSNDTLRLRAQSLRFGMDDRQIRSLQTRISLYFGQDSIFHPDLSFTYLLENEELRLNKNEDFTSKGPYANSYHGVDMNFDELSWTRGDTLFKMQAQQGTSVSRATFESNTFFNFDFYMSLQGMDYVHPLGQLATYSRVVHSRVFYSLPYADYVGHPEYQIKHQLMTLSKLGFLYYDDESGQINLRQKLFDYMDAARQKRDYDVIRFNSRPRGGINAELDINNKNLTIHGIPLIFLSDSQNVRLVPTNNSIVMKENRSFEFDGVVDAGLFRFRGRDFFFNYDSFKIDLMHIDSLQLSIRTGEVNDYGDPILTQIDNAMEQMTGVLWIDDPNNKSGLESYPRYPTFSSEGTAFIFFDDPKIQDGVYKRDQFFFELNAFTVDSLDNFQAQSISPSGTFFSAGILPPLEMDMTLREDNSLGFYMQTPEEGLDLYGGVATFYNDIEMSSRGLHAYGSVDYLSSTTWSDDILLHPDSLMAMSNRYLLREVMGMSNFPYVENTEADIRLYPLQDTMTMAKVEENFKIFNDSVWHSGDLVLTPMGLTGVGVVATDEARMESEEFTYETRAIYADSAGVKLRASVNEDFTFETNDISLYVDLDTRRGVFQARGETTKADMTYTMYETELDSMTWNMDQGTLMMAESEGLQSDSVQDIGIDSLESAASPVFTSTNPAQEALSFVSSEAVYDYREKQLTATRVPFIKVADAYIFPNAGNVKVGYQANMDTLRNAKVLANQKNRKHLIYEANISINGARDYGGNGFYSYRDDFGNEYPIRFKRIWVDSTRTSRSNGQIGEEDEFMMSPFFDFQGKVDLHADEDFLTFDGGVRLVHDCGIGRSWVRFTSAIDPANIRIPVGEQLLDTDLNKAFAGSLITRDSTHIYSTFLSSRRDYFDANLTQATGMLIHDPEANAYLIASEAKLADREVEGDFLQLLTSQCLVSSEGKVNLNLDYGQVKLKASGETSHDVDADRFEARLLMGMDFMFSEEALRVMGAEIDSLPSLEPVDLSDRHYQVGMRNLLGETMAGNLESQLSLAGGYTEIPPAWRHTIFFNDFPLEWNQDTRSFRYRGKVGIGNIGNIQVNKKVDAYVEFVERGSGDVFDIYLEVDRRTWYYLAYSPGGLQVLSSNQRFNDIVFNLKANDRRIKGKPGTPPYVYSLAAQRRMQLFIERFLEFDEF